MQGNDHHQSMQIKCSLNFITPKAWLKKPKAWRQIYRVSIRPVHSRLPYFRRPENDLKSSSIYYLLHYIALMPLPRWSFKEITQVLGFYLKNINT